MDYIETKYKILDITNELNSVVSVEDHNYTHQPDEKQIVNSIDHCIERLSALKSILKS